MANNVEGFDKILLIQQIVIHTSAYAYKNMHNLNTGTQTQSHTKINYIQAQTLDQIHTCNHSPMMHPGTHSCADVHRHTCECTHTCTCMLSSMCTHKYTHRYTKAQA